MFKKDIEVYDGNWTSHMASKLDIIIQTIFYLGVVALIVLGSL